MDFKTGIGTPGPELRCKPELEPWILEKIINVFIVITMFTLKQYHEIAIFGKIVVVKTAIFGKIVVVFDFDKNLTQKN